MRLIRIPCTMGWAENSKLYSKPYNISYGTRLQELQRQDFDRYAENMEYTEHKVEGYKPIQLKAEMPEGNGSFLKPKEDAIALEYDGKSKNDQKQWYGKEVFFLSRWHTKYVKVIPHLLVYMYIIHTRHGVCVTQHWRNGVQLSSGSVNSSSNIKSRQNHSNPI